MDKRTDKIRLAQAAINKAVDLEKTGDRQNALEAKSYRNAARRILAKLGLTEADIQERDHLVLPAQHKPWEKALAEVLFAHLGFASSSSSKGLMVRASAAKVPTVKRRFDEARRAVLQASSGFSRQMKMTIDLSGVAGLSDTFCNFVVLGVAEMLPPADGFEESPMSELDRLLDNPGAAHIDYQKTAPSGYRGGHYRHRPQQVIKLSPGPAGFAAASAVCAQISR